MIGLSGSCSGYFCLVKIFFDCTSHLQEEASWENVEP
jgi:hypothetical protein